MKEITIIKPAKQLSFLDLNELYNYRKLVWVLALKEIKIRYKQTLNDFLYNSGNFLL